MKKSEKNTKMLKKKSDRVGKRTSYFFSLLLTQYPTEKNK